MINFLQADAAVAQQPGMGGFWIMMLAMIAVMYFFMWRPESKRRKEMAKFREGLKQGEPTILIEVDSNVTLRVDKNMVVADNSQLQK